MISYYLDLPLKSFNSFMKSIDDKPFGPNMVPGLFLHVSSRNLDSLVLVQNYALVLCFLYDLRASS